MNRRLDAVSALEDTLGYRFVDRERLGVALTHAGAAQGARGPGHNERLEFLGDRVLGLVIADALVRRFPEAREGDLSARLHALVSRDACARVARRLGLTQAIRLAPGDAKSGARENPTILGDACEALIAALYLEAGLEKVRDVMMPFWEEEFEAYAGPAAHNPKSRLQEWAAGRRALVQYRLVDRIGPDHAPLFTMAVEVEGLEAATGQGRSRQEAEKAAATALLERQGLS